MISSFFFFNDTATTEIYTLSLHDALPISLLSGEVASSRSFSFLGSPIVSAARIRASSRSGTECFRVRGIRSEEHTSELQSRLHLVCRLLLEKKKTCIHTHNISQTFFLPAT